MLRTMAHGLILVIAGVSQAGSTSNAVVSFKKGGQEVELTKAEQGLLAERIRHLMSDCWLNSSNHPDRFSERDLPKEWQEMTSGTHIHAQFNEPFQSESWNAPPLPVSEVLVGLEHEYFIGPELTRHEGTVTTYIKCDGQRALDVMCAPPLRAHLTTEQTKNCERYDERRRSKPK